MKCVISDLLKATSPFCPELLGDTNPSKEVEFIAIEEISVNTEFVPWVLYIGYQSQVQNTLRYLSSINFLLIADMEYFSCSRECFKNTLILFPQNINKDELLRHCHEFLNRRKVSEEWNNQLLQDFLRSDTLDAFISTVSARMNISIIVFGRGGNIISTALANSDDQNKWLDQFRRNIISYEFLATIYNNPVMIRNADTKQPFILKLNHPDTEICLVNIFYQQRRIGNVLFFKPETDYSPQIIDYCHQIAILISKLININYNIVTTKKDPLGLAFLDLLSGKIQSKDELNSRMSNINIKKTSLFAIGTVKIDKYHNYNYFNDLLVSNCEQVFHCMYSVYFENYVVFLFDVDESNFPPCTQWSGLQSFFEENHLTMGLSDSFHNLFYTRFYYQQSLKALKYAKIAQSDKPLEVYDDYKFYDFVISMQDNADGNESISTYLSLSVQQMDRYDAENNTEYCDTVLAYLKFNLKLSATANYLHVHKNTLSYRLAKAKELFNLNFEHHDQNFWLHASLILRKMLKNGIIK